MLTGISETDFHKMKAPLSDFPSETEQSKVSEWHQREIQLSRLHEEILMQREVMLSYSTAYLQSQNNRSMQESIEQGRARARNEKFLEGIVTTQDMLYREACSPPSPRLTTLQNNYWAMVRNIIPLWERSLEKADKGSKGSKKNPNQNNNAATGRHSVSGKKKTALKSSSSSKSGGSKIKKLLRF